MKRILALAIALFATAALGADDAAIAKAKADHARIVKSCKTFPPSERPQCVKRVDGYLAAATKGLSEVKPAAKRMAIVAPTVTVGPGETQTVTFTVIGGSGTPPPPPPPPPPSGVKLMTLDWQSPQRIFTRDVGGFADGDIIAVKFTTGGVSSTNNLPNITGVEFDAAPWDRTWNLSETAGDFGPPHLAPGSHGQGNSVTAVFALGNGSGFGYYPVLKLNTTYYLNMRNSAGGGGNMSVNLIKTGGL